MRRSQRAVAGGAAPAGGPAPHAQSMQEVEKRFFTATYTAQVEYDAIVQELWLINPRVLRGR